MTRTERAEVMEHNSIEFRSMDVLESREGGFMWKVDQTECGWRDSRSDDPATDGRTRLKYYVRSYAEHQAATTPPKPEYRDYTIDKVPCGSSVPWATYEGKADRFHGPITTWEDNRTGETWVYIGPLKTTLSNIRKYATWDDTGLPLGVEVTP